jgi:hypothetical protein
VNFDAAHWSKIINQPDWYLAFNKFKTEAEQKLGPESEEMAQLNKKVRHFFENALKNNQVVLATAGPDLDKERQSIDTVVIHHTSAKPGYRLSYLNAVHLLNIYAPYFANPTVQGEEKLKGAPIWSGHFSAGQPVFWAYHWLIRMDGTATRLLNDDKIGWHSGNWQINRRSVAICLDSDYEKMCPADWTIAKIAKHIKQNYPKVDTGKIIGHCEAREGTSCPGSHFINEWKTKLIQLVENSDS